MILGKHAVTSELNRQVVVFSLLKCMKLKLLQISSISRYFTTRPAAPHKEADLVGKVLVTDPAMFHYGTRNSISGTMLNGASLRVGYHHCCGCQEISFLTEGNEILQSTLMGQSEMCCEASLE